MADIDSQRVWFTSSYSSPHLCCVEVAHLTQTTYVRDTKWERKGPAVGPRPVLEISPEGWAACLDAIREGRDASELDELAIRNEDDRAGYTFSAPGSSVTLTFNQDEMDAFRNGVLDGEFDRPEAGS